MLEDLSILDWPVISFHWHSTENNIYCEILVLHVKMSDPVLWTARWSC